jgi:Ca2+-binding RTX toxin-like protein
VVPRQAKPYNCFKLAEGNDRITVSSGDNVIYPGPGRNVIIAQAGTKETQVVYEGGDDIIHFMGGSSTLDLRHLKRDQITFDIIKKTPSTVEPGQAFDPENRPTVDLLIRTPVNSIIIADHFANKALKAIITKDVRLYDDTITLEAVTDQITDTNDQIDGTEILDIISSGKGNDVVNSYRGDDVITYTSGHDRYDPGEGKDILELPGYKASQVRFSVDKNREDVKISIDPENSILLSGQLINPPTGDAFKFHSIQFDDKRLMAPHILERSVSDQSTSGPDQIFGTKYSDILRPGEGTNSIYPGAGSDIIYHEGGIDTIFPERDTEMGSNVLVIDGYARPEITFTVGGEDDLILTTPTGAMVIIKHHFAVTENGKSGGVTEFRLKGEDLPDDIMRKLYFPEGHIAPQQGR